LKRVLLILTLIFGIGVSAMAQERPGSAAIAIQKKVRFYPNPANVVINFELQQTSADNQASLLIFNFMGKKVYEQKNIPNKLTVNLEDFYRGIYIFQLRDKNGIILDSGKFQVVK
jgi:hypothetical protein